MPDRLRSAAVLSVTASSFAAAATLFLLAHRVCLQVTSPLSLAAIVYTLPRDGWLPAYPLISLAIGVWACRLRSVKTVLTVQVTLFIVGFLHVQWELGTVPVKIDFRIVYAALIAQSIAWASVLCGFSSLLMGIGLTRERRRGPRKPESGIPEA